MSNNRRKFIEAMLALPALPLLAQAGDKITPIILRGRVVNLAAEFALRHQITLETAQRGVIYCLKTADGKLYPFLPTDTAAAIYKEAAAMSDDPAAKKTFLLKRANVLREAFKNDEAIAALEEELAQLREHSEQLRDQIAEKAAVKIES